MAEARDVAVPKNSVDTREKLGGGAITEFGGLGNEVPDNRLRDRQSLCPHEGLSLSHSCERVLTPRVTLSAR